MASGEQTPLPYAMPPSDPVWVPFSLRHDPMERLLVADFSDDPVYNGLEIQVYDDPGTGSGLALLMYRVDGEFDRYLTPGLELDRDAAAAGSGRGEWITQDFTGHLEISAGHVTAGVDAVLYDGVPLHFEMVERRRRGRGIDLLGPRGVTIDKPKFLPLFYMYGLDLVARRGTHVALSIGGAERTLDRMPVPIPHRGRFCYRIRHCADPFIVKINATGTGQWVSPADQGRGFSFRQRSGYHELTGIEIVAGGHTCWMRFDPPVPDLLALSPGYTAAGRARIGLDDTPVIGARYSLRTRDDGTEVQFQPIDDWAVAGNALVRWTVSMFPSVCRTWPKTYRWYGTVEADGVVNSRWERVSE